MLIPILLHHLLLYCHFPNSALFQSRLTASVRVRRKVTLFTTFLGKEFWWWVGVNLGVGSSIVLFSLFIIFVFADRRSLSGAWETALIPPRTAYSSYLTVWLNHYYYNPLKNFQQPRNFLTFERKLIFSEKPHYPRWWHPIRKHSSLFWIVLATFSSITLQYIPHRRYRMSTRVWTHVIKSDNEEHLFESLGNPIPFTGYASASLLLHTV